MLNAVTARQASLAVFVTAAATIVGAWIFEFMGYLPCDLCLKQRWAYYAAIPLAFLLAVSSSSLRGVARAGFVLLTLIWMVSMVFGIYHSGIEWKWWPGPGTCTGTAGLSGGLPDLSAPVVMCDEPAIRILGLSLAGWNALISAALACVAWQGARSQGSSSVSQ